MAMVVAHRLSFSSCVLLMFAMGQALRGVDAAAAALVTDGVYPMDMKRDGRAGSDSEEFVSLPSLPGQGDYDEYPMVVPKRAALLLDRLMVALHRALEEERHSRRRLSDVYAHEKTPSFDPKTINLAEFDPAEHDNMYSDEGEPDFDLRNLRDLKSPSRVNGETLMAKSFQRRAPHDEDSASGRSSGRMYWRCYFNAVSCF